MKKNKKINYGLLSPVVMALLLIVMAAVIWLSSKIVVNEMKLCTAMSFYLIAFTSCILYFLGRENNNYEYLMLTLISIITGSYLFVFDIPTYLMLGSSITIFTTLFVINRGYVIIKNYKENNFMWIVVFYGTFLIGLLGFFTSFNFYKEITNQAIMLSFFFSVTGIINALEGVIGLKVTQNKYNKLSTFFAKPDSKLEEIKEDVKETIKEVTPKVKKTVKEAAKKVEEKVREEAPKVKEAVKKATPKVKKAVKKAVVKTEKVVKENAPKVKEAVKKATTKKVTKASTTKKTTPKTATKKAAVKTTAKKVAPKKETKKTTTKAAPKKVTTKKTTKKVTKK